jgi:membrane-bound lytic murein transglycosylase MltF
MIIEGVALYLLFKNAKTANEQGTMTLENDAWTKYDSLFQKYAAINGLDWKDLKAVAMNESSLGAAESVAIGLDDPANVVESASYDKKSWGLMQVTLTTARDLDSSATAQKLNNPEYSISLAARYFARLSKYFSASDARYKEWLIKSYNQGPGNTQKEISGLTSGYANEYWARFQRNRAQVAANS